MTLRLHNHAAFLRSLSCRFSVQRGKEQHNVHSFDPVDSFIIKILYVCLYKIDTLPWEPSRPFLCSIIIFWPLVWIIGLASVNPFDIHWRIEALPFTKSRSQDLSRKTLLIYIHLRTSHHKIIASVCCLGFQATSIFAIFCRPHTLACKELCSEFQHSLRQLTRLPVP